MKKFKRNWEEESRWFQENYGNIIGKNWSNFNWWCWYYEEILESFSEIILVKLGKASEEILEKLWKNIENATHKILKNIWQNFIECLKKYLKIFRKPVGKGVQIWYPIVVFGSTAAHVGQNSWIKNQNVEKKGCLSIFHIELRHKLYINLEISICAKNCQNWTLMKNAANLVPLKSFWKKSEKIRNINLFNYKNCIPSHRNLNQYTKRVLSLHAAGLRTI